MAKRRRKKKKGGLSYGDLEALALVLLGAFLFLAASLWPPTPLSGDLGQLLRRELARPLGLIAYWLPLPFGVGAIWALKRGRLAAFLRLVALSFLLIAFLLPLLAPLSPGLAGELGVGVYRALRARVGLLWPLLPLVLLLPTLDVLFKRPPYDGLKRAVLALNGFFQRRRAAQAARSARRAVQKEARKLLGEAEALYKRYPEHAALLSLIEELRQAARDPAKNLEPLAELLEDFQLARAEELKTQIEAEARPLLPPIEEALLELKVPLTTDAPLFRLLDERRRALFLEFKGLKNQHTRLTKEAQAALGRLPGDLEAEARAHEARKKAWQNLEAELYEALERLAAWRRWRGWAEAAPEEVWEAGYKLLMNQGLLAPPPRIKEEGVAPEPTQAQGAGDEEVELDLDLETPPPAPRKLERPAGLALPTPELLDPPPKKQRDARSLEAEAAARAEIINETLAQFGLKAKVVDWARGPTVTRYEIQPAPGEKIARIASLANDLARALAVGSVRIEAPIPGKSVIGLEVPNAERELVSFAEALLDKSYQKSRARLPLILGKSIEGEFWVRDLAKMPHLLIAGSTGSGKSVSVNTLIMSLLFKYLPTELRFLMIDPKMVELTPYDGIPHLVRGVVTNPADAAGVLLGAVAHMERRYKMMSKAGVRSLEQYNQKMREAGEPTLPYLVIVIDELADLMITSPKEVEQAILRLAQMARATGMHLILATQRPSVDILTSLIKVNIPARIAFAVSSSHDSRTILDATGAERLTGQGDMLFYQPGLAKPVRLQGPFLSDAEIHRVAAFLRQQEFEDAFGEKYGADFDGPLTELPGGPAKGAGKMDFSDPLLEAAARIVVEEGQGSVSRLQRRLSVGHARAGKLMDMLEAMGIVGPHQGSKPREVLITADQLEEYFGKAH